LRIVYQPREPRNAAAVKDVVGGMLRIARRDFDRALAIAAGDDADGQVIVEGDKRTLWAARGTGWVTDRELIEINRLLAALVARLRKPRGGARQRLVSLCFQLAPMTARPVRRPARRRRAK
jgi:hypothetical protein